MTLLSHKLINNREQMKTNPQDFEASLKKVFNLRSQILVHKLRLLIEKTHPNFDVSLMVEWCSVLKTGRRKLLG